MGSLLERLRGAMDPLGIVHDAPPGSRRTAAVLLLFDSTHDGLPLLFIERTAHLRHHAGQIGFPGGGTEAQDPTIVATAVREAGEEAGVPADAVEVIGVLPPFMTATSDNWLTPVVGIQNRDIELRPDPFEVARLFRLDLTALMAAPHTVHTLTHEGLSREVHFYDVDGNVVWGVTAAIVNELIGRIESTAG
ncbi:MAG: CoA pyrophosphatase [Candidatus Dormibacteraeota bacterium]|nr:CoA pyrophosphatase [Candidatus Dormibacteraeota bacterium]